MQILKLFGLSKKWVILWLVANWLPLMIIGLGSKYQPQRERLMEGDAEGPGADGHAAQGPISLNVSVPETNEGLSIHLKERVVTDFGKEHRLLKDVAMNIPPKSLVLLLGGSGAGKTTLITLLICHVAGVHFPKPGVITRWGIVDMGITILLVTYAADIMALMVSCLVRNTTIAMTVMPFLLIYQLIFSGNFFDLGAADFIKVTTISHWGSDSLCVIGRYNEQPMVSLWNTLVQFKDADFYGEKPLLYVLQGVEKNGMLDDFLKWSGQNNIKPAYEAIPANVLPAWGAILLMIVIFTAVAVIALKFIDKDKR